MPTERVTSIDAGRTCVADAWSDESPESVLSEIRGAAKLKLLGLPCARCHLYYNSDLTACPRCGFTKRERVGEPTSIQHKAA